MTLELSILAWTLVLALVQVLLPALLRNRETGTEYNAGPRDDDGAPMGVVTGRLFRAQRNLFETLPLFIAAILIVHVSGHAGTLSHWAAWLYLISRIVYVPLYAAGIPYLRSLVWLASIAAILLLLLALF